MSEGPEDSGNAQVLKGLVAGEDTTAPTPLTVVEPPIADVPLPVDGVPAHANRETGDIEDVGVAVREKRPVFAVLLCLDELGDFPELHFVMLRKLGLDLLVVGVLGEIERLQLRSGDRKSTRLNSSHS